MPAGDPPPVAELPLPGGRPEATVTVYPLLCGEQLAPPAWFDRPSALGLLRTIVDRSDWVWIPLQAFLVMHPAAGAVLVDTGLHPTVSQDPKRSLGPLMGRMARLRFRPEQTVRRQLADHGVSPEDLTAVVMTHLHYDHAGGIPDLLGPRFLVDRREWKAARAEGWRGGYDPSHRDLPIDWRSVTFDGAAPHGGFAHTLDVFGDGSLRLLSTPGHTHGHMSVLARLRERDLLLCIDAIYTLGSLTEDLTPLLAADRAGYAASREQIRRHVAQAPDTVVVPGHDAEAWSALDSVYS